MKTPEIREEGSRIFIQTHGDQRLLAALKELRPRPKWEGPPTKEWSLPKDMLDAVERVIADWKDAPAEEPVKEDPNKITLVAKCVYKGRNYFVRRVFGEDATPKAWLVSFDGSISFKVSLDLIEITKRYEPRETRHGRDYMTLGKIQRFVADQKAKEAGTAPKRVRCQECDSWMDADGSCRDCGGC